MHNISVIIFFIKQITTVSSLFFVGFFIDKLAVFFAITIAYQRSLVHVLLALMVEIAFRRITIIGKYDF